MANQYFAGNGAEPTTVSRVAVATGTGIKTLLQIAPPSTGVDLVLVAWGISFDASAAGVPGIIELIETDVAATGGTSLTPTKYSNPTGPASLCVGGTGLTCYSPTVEGTISAVRTADVQQIAPTSQFVYEWALGREFRVQVAKFPRVRVKFAASVNAICWVRWEE